MVADSSFHQTLKVSYLVKLSALETDLDEGMRN